jgi:hypothetical protein
VAKVQAGAEFKNTLVVSRMLRVRVLDCRSGQPLQGVPVQELRINGKAVVRYRAAHKDWDISTHFPLYEKDSQWFFGTKAGTLIKASQRALNALGFDCGSPSDSYGPQGKTAFLQYQVRCGDMQLDAKDVAKIKLFEVKKIADKWLKPPNKDALKDIVDQNGDAVPFTAPTPEECRNIIAIYNTRSYSAAQFHLASLGYYPGNKDPLGTGAMDDQDLGTWPESWKQAFKAWQRVEFGYTANQCWDWIKREKEGKKLQDRDRNFVTNDHGDIHIPVPVSMLGSQWTLEVGFADFAIVAEAKEVEYQDKNKAQIPRRYGPPPPVKAPPAGSAPAAPAAPKKYPIPGPTKFSIEWFDSQVGSSVADKWDKGWGWRCGNQRSISEEERKSFTEFRTSWTFTVPAFNEAELGDPAKGPQWQVLHQRTKAFSMFYDSEEDMPEFVVFALVWCQPVWDEIKDPGRLYHTNSNVYVDVDAGAQLKDRSHNMHVVTVASKLGGSDPYGNKGYGKIAKLPAGSIYPWRSHEHAGLDMHAVLGAKVFAVHAGRLTRLGGLQPAPNNPGQYLSPGGNYVQIVWSGEGQTVIMCLHFSQYLTPTHEHVKAGQVVGLAGRTGNLSPRKPDGQPGLSGNPGHTHLNMGAVGNHTALETTPDADNRVCIPTNNTPLLFPCRCEVNDPAQDPSGCQFQNSKFTKTCWAVAELVCPYMWKDQTNFRLQAQLRYLFEKKIAPPGGFPSGSAYLNPGPTDGTINPVPDPGTAASPTRQAIRAFRIANQLTPQDAKPYEGCEMDSEAWSKLNEQAPVVEPEGASHFNDAEPGPQTSETA